MMTSVTYPVWLVEKHEYWQGGERILLAVCKTKEQAFEYASQLLDAHGTMVRETKLSLPGFI